MHDHESVSIEEMIEDLILVSNSQDFKMSLFFKIKELKAYYVKQKANVRKIKNVIEPRETTQTVRIDFKMHKTKSGWIIDNDGLPRELIEYILANSKPGGGGVIEMHPVKLKSGREITLSFQKETELIYTGFFTEKIRKVGETVTRKNQYSKSSLSIPTGKKQFLETVLIYLDECEEFYNAISDMFFQKWKPAIDSGIFRKKVI